MQKLMAVVVRAVDIVAARAVELVSERFKRRSNLPIPTVVVVPPSRPRAPSGSIDTTSTTTTTTKIIEVDLIVVNATVASIKGRPLHFVNSKLIVKVFASVFTLTTHWPHVVL
jgi:hypothetical protein